MDLQPKTNRVVVIGHCVKLWDSSCVIGGGKLFCDSDFVGEELCANLRSDSKLHFSVTSCLNC